MCDCVCVCMYVELGICSFSGIGMEIRYTIKYHTVVLKRPKRAHMHKYLHAFTAAFQGYATTATKLKNYVDVCVYVSCACL
jgi:hypothetical protein